MSLPPFQRLMRPKTHGNSNFFPRLLLFNVAFLSFIIYLAINAQLLPHVSCKESAAPSPCPKTSHSSNSQTEISVATPNLTKQQQQQQRKQREVLNELHQLRKLQKRHVSEEELAARVRRRRPMPLCARNNSRARGFLIVFMGHSGSTAIATELRQHPQVRVGITELVDHQDVFNTTAALAEATRFFEDGERHNLTAGFKIRPMHILHAPHKWRALVRDFGLRIIWQHRKNLFKAAVGEYSHRVLKDKSVVEGLRRPMRRAERCAIGAGCSFAVRNITSLAVMLRSGVRSHRAISRAVYTLAAGSGGCVREVPYEDYLYERAETMRDIRNFLGLSDVNTKPARFKATGDNMCEVLSNWDEVCERLYGCVVWQWMMDDARNSCFCPFRSGAPDATLCTVDE